LTCLSYYYGSLTQAQLYTCFEHLLKIDNPEHEYAHWTAGNSLVPEAIRQLGGVNIEDVQQFKHVVFPALNTSKAVIDFYLAQIVFPKAAKEFPSKLSTSGWDLAERKAHVTTGFSGTNDNRFLLPTSISQCDPVQQLSTNALVLGYLLQPENNHYRCIQGGTKDAPTSEEFLALLVRQEPPIRVLLDVGAQMLDKRNDELVKHWLKLLPDVAAAVFFADNDELSVLTQDGTTEPFASSPYKQQLDKCVVYLDDVHTRGTDLKLPVKTRAAVTLGPKVTKDRLVQGTFWDRTLTFYCINFHSGCMRMRKLGHGQSKLTVRFARRET
jgi:hypothetical protein